MSTICANCQARMKHAEPEVWGIKELLAIDFCPKCQRVEAIVQTIKAFKGTAQRGIYTPIGESRLKIAIPEERFRKDIILKIFPNIVVTKPSELHLRGRRFYTTRERTAWVFPEIKRGDEIAVAGFYAEDTPLFAILIRNLSVGITSTFVNEEITLKKGFFSSFNVKNPVLIEAEKQIETVL